MDFSAPNASFDDDHQGETFKKYVMLFLVFICTD